MASPSFEDLLATARWRPIRDCPGRFVLCGPPTTATPRDLAGPEVCVEEYRVACTPDRVLVARLPGGGLLSFLKPDGRFVHTLNTEDGLRRRLARLGLAPEDGPT